MHENEAEVWSGLVDRNVMVQARNEVLAHGPLN